MINSRTLSFSNPSGTTASSGLDIPQQGGIAALIRSQLPRYNCSRAASAESIVFMPKEDNLNFKREAMRKLFTHALPHELMIDRPGLSGHSLGHGGRSF